MVPADKAYHTADPSTWEEHFSQARCKDIFVSSQLIENHYQPQVMNKNDVMHTERKYHVRRECQALKISQVIRISICKFCENKTR